ncbi:oligoendopeptidase F [Granulicatella balaenopterae]|uniref:Oligopeptidase F n=1 Tax=Granulicatella balaenopterae TaxID=137733 RepID=A0A1H9NYE3_9LACT|nr:oligoendopeptidase F [Granulicatella balaenopterae]SER40970.1 oligoendopeptidase F [Granulicatella balaenopterae]
MSDNTLKPRSAVNQEYTWDMSLMYQDDAAFAAALKKMEEAVVAFNQKFAGKVTNVENLEDAITEFEVLYEEFYKLSHYAELPMTVDRFNPTVVENATLFQNTATIWAANMSFFDVALTELSAEVTEEFVATKRPDLAYYFEKINKQKAHMLDPKVEQALASLNNLPNFYQLYEVTKHEDMTFDSFEVDGKTYENSYVLYENLHEMDNNTKVRRGAAESFYKTLNAYKNTTANEYISTIKREKLLATMRGYDSVIDYLLDQQDGDRELYDRQIKTLMTDLAPHIRRYIKLLGKVHNIPDMQFADCKINLDPDFEVDMTIDESRDYLKKAFAGLGQDYLDLVDESYDKRWTDFPQNIGKSTGGFCATVKDVAAYILLSWTGKMNEVFVLAHELGHAYHFMNAGRHQSILNFDCALYFVESPSTCNEVIVSNYLLKTNTDPRFKRWVISNMISRTYFHNMVTHYLEAVYQDRIYKMVDNNEMLNADVLSKVKREVMEEFFGDSLTINEGAELTWMRQPHYYMGLYSYTYSAGLTIGTAIANKIEKDPEHAQRWLDTLAKGGSMSAKDLCKFAGCDVSTAEPLNEAIAYVGELVDQLYTLTDELEAK